MSIYNVNFMPNAEQLTKAIEKSKAQFGSSVGQAHYKQMLGAARAQTPDMVGVSPHMVRPTSRTSRLGFKGKRPSKKDMALIADRMLQTALKQGADQQFIKATINMARFNKGQ